jgi:hypothetical protein
VWYQQVSQFKVFDLRSCELKRKRTLNKSLAYKRTMVSASSSKRSVVTCHKKL